MKAYCSLMSFYMYDNTLFDDCYFPEGAVRDVIVSETLANTAELEVIYPDAGIMKMMLTVYTRSRIESWQKMYDALMAQYNPIWNKDGTIEEETHTDNTGRSQSVTNAKNDTYVTAFNDDAPKQNTEATAGSDGSFNSNAVGDQVTRRREYGNIGVTKSSELVRDEVILRASYDITHIIAAEIKKRFCLMIY